MEVLNAIHESAFMGFAHGFRPGRNPHQALDALAYGIRSRQGSFLLMRQTRRDRKRARLRELKAELRTRMHHSIPVVGKWPGQVMRG